MGKKRNPRTKDPFIHGKRAWEKGMVHNPYPKISNGYALWNKGYLSAAQYKIQLIESRAPQGSAPHKDSYIVVKRTGSTKRLPASAPREQKHQYYLGYIKPGKNGKPRRFFVWTRNPEEDKWKNKIANKSYKEPKE